MKPTQIVIEEREGDGFIRLSSDVLQRLGVGVGDSLYLVDAYVENYRTLVFSKTPSIQDRTDGMFEPRGVSEADRLLSVRSLKGVIAKPNVPVRVEEMRPSWSTLSDSPKADADFLQERPGIVDAGSNVDLLACSGVEDVELEPNILRDKSTKE
jgi:hypothetical protein